MLTVLASYSVNVEELKSIFHKLKGENQTWVRPFKIIKTPLKSRLNFFFIFQIVEKFG